MSVKERLKKFIKSENLTVVQFEKSISVSNGYVNGMVNGIGNSKLNKILELYPNLNIQWLLTGDGSMLKKLKTNESMIVNEPTLTYGKTNEIPLLPLEAFAGNGDENTNGVSHMDLQDKYIVPLFDGLKTDFMISVKGSSMYPKYSSGDVVACRMIEELLFIQWNKVYVIDTISQGVIMKRLKKADSEESIICKSDNKEYDEFSLPKKDIRKIALVVGVIRLE